MGKGFSRIGNPNLLRFLQNFDHLKASVSYFFSKNQKREQTIEEIEAANAKFKEQQTDNSDTNEYQDEDQDKKEEFDVEDWKKKKELTKKSLQFPWWCKIIAYMLSFIFAFVSLFFIVIKGISLGDIKVSKWLTSLLSSFISSVLLTQPIQVNLKDRKICFSKHFSYFLN